MLHKICRKRGGMVLKLRRGVLQYEYDYFRQKSFKLLFCFNAQCSTFRSDV